VTFYKSAEQLPPFTDYNMKGRTYRYFKGDPLYPFGYGLSYTTFAYRKLSLPGEVKAGDSVKVTVEVANTGARAGEEVVQLYMKMLDAPESTPLRSLAGFERVALRVGERKTVEFVLSPRQLSSLQANGRRIAGPGAFEISVGGGQPGKTAGPAIVTGTLKVSEPPKELN